MSKTEVKLDDISLRNSLLDRYRTDITNPLAITIGEKTNKKFFYKKKCSTSALAISHYKSYRNTMTILINDSNGRRIVGSYVTLFDRSDT